MTVLHRLPNGHSLREFRIESQIGGGGFGLVYAATDTTLERTVVIKEYLPPELSVRDPDRVTVQARSEREAATYAWGLERFVEEAKWLARLRHPHIVQVYQVFCANNTAYMVMEDEGRRSLRDIFNAVRILNLTQVQTLLDALLSALEVVHGRDLLHRDLKPENILIRENDMPVLIDFGSARQQVSGRTRPLTALVSAGYAPLEQYHTEGRQGPYTDLYGLGAVLYEGLTGAAPPEVTGRVLDDRIVSLEQTLTGRYPRELLRAVDACLKLRPAERPADIAALRAALRPEEAPSLPPIIPLPPLEKGGRGGFRTGDGAKIPPNPPLLKGGTEQPREDATPSPALIEPVMVRISGGDFLMGSPTLEAHRGDDERQHRVRVEAFEIGKYQVTQGEWEAVMGNNPSYFKKGDRYPVEQVSWYDAQDYIRRLNQHTGRTYRLPTEAEWEYAARAGTTTAYGWGDAPSQNRANCDGCGSRRGGRSTAPVGSFEPNAWELYDMAGNVWEWTSSLYDKDYHGGEQQCSYKETPGPRALRGGAGTPHPPGCVRRLASGSSPLVVCHASFRGLRVC